MADGVSAHFLIFIERGLRMELTEGGYTATPTGGQYVMRGRDGMTIGWITETPSGWTPSGHTVDIDGGRPPGPFATPDGAFAAYLRWAGYITPEE